MARRFGAKILLAYVEEDRLPPLVIEYMAVGVDDILGKRARCCNPVPGDNVVGFVSRGRGIVIHRRDCPNVVHSQEPERLMEIDWGQDRRNNYTVTIMVDLANRVGVTRQTIIALEADRYVPSLLLAVRLARVFGMAVEELFVLGQNEQEQGP